jgi:hypothetical protein
MRVSFLAGLGPYTPWLHEGRVEGSAEGDPEQA